MDEILVKSKEELIPLIGCVSRVPREIFRSLEPGERDLLNMQALCITYSEATNDYFVRWKAGLKHELACNDPWTCVHANEVPTRCPCDVDCYCKTRSCQKAAVVDSASKWDKRFVRLSQHVSQWSKDPSTKTGAVIVRPDRSVASVGFNGFAQGMKDDAVLYDNREVKYARVVHCEMNALMFCRDPLPLTGYTLYTTGPCCERCSVHMIQAGLRRFVFVAPSHEQAKRWNTAATMSNFAEVGAEVVQMGAADVEEA